MRHRVNDKIKALIRQPSTAPVWFNGQSYKRNCSNHWSCCNCWGFGCGRRELGSGQALPWHEDADVFRPKLGTGVVTCLGEQMMNQMSWV